MPNDWTRDQLIATFDLYCRKSYRSFSSRSPEVIELAQKIGRSPGAVNMKLGNFASLDPTVLASGGVGLKNSSKADREIWAEFGNNWEALSLEAAKIRNTDVFEGDFSFDEEVLAYLPGLDKKALVSIRVHQSFFREAVLSAYDNKCCITGLSARKLLVASHIKPWKVSDPATERTNPRNGLCLNALHDKAFDRGLITLDEKYCVELSSELENDLDIELLEQFFYGYEGKRIMMPNKFVPDADMLRYHRETIFLG